MIAERAFFEFLDAVVVGDWAQAANQLAITARDRETFTRLIARHDVAPWLQWRLSEDDGFRHLPAWLRIELMSFSQRDRQHTEQLLQVLGRISDVAGDTFLLMKGPHFALRFYGDLYARRICDLDLLAVPGELDSLEKALRDLGFQAGHHSFYPRRWLHHFVHARGYNRAGFEVDLHTNLRVRPAFRIDPGDFWQHRRQLSVAGRELSCLSDEHSLLLLLLSIAGDLELGKLRAKSLVDLQAAATLLESDGDWGHFIDQRAQENLQGIAVNVLHCLSQLLPQASALPGMQAVLAQHRGLCVAPRGEDTLVLATAPPYCPANRRWFLQVYPGNRWWYVVWLALGIPAKQGLGRALGFTFRG